ncbi:MAG: carboxypeptidase-like regulatory domain-containing protein [Acidobacteria bacterium]|nr:carboxypeptidase-like regulatory domain-containing protein [Acidobacteriota bacterium]MCL5288820.1 carboxypeptidase-like regulatory domain-containing protein [Acidobacteriota bacterium]
MRRMALTLLLAGLAGWAGASAANAQQEKPKRPPEVVITGTVFDERGFSLAGVRLRVNRVGERKARWEAMSDRRGEFGVRVPQGVEYEVRASAKGFEEQVQKVDGKSSTYESLVFRMVPVKEGRKP